MASRVKITFLLQSKVNSDAWLESVVNWTSLGPGVSFPNWPTKLPPVATPSRKPVGTGALDVVVTVTMLITVAVATVLVTRSVTPVLVTTTVESVVVWVATIFVNDSTTVMVVTGAATVVVWAVTLIEGHALECRTEPETS